MPDLSTKRCPKCGMEKPLVQFSPDKRAKDGRQSSCKECCKLLQRAWRRANPNKHSARCKAYQSRNKDRLRAKRIAHRQTLTGYASALWASLNGRTINGGHPQWQSEFAGCYLRRGVCLAITRVELFATVAAWWERIREMRAAGQIPSIDRIDPDGHYSVDNIRFIPLHENVRKQRHRRPVKHIQEE
jgi:hypothetical protein